MRVLDRPSMLLICGFLVSAACGSKGNPIDPPPPPPPQQGQVTVTSVSVAGTNSVTVGQTSQFTATANMSNSTTQNVSTTATWASSNTGVATVSSTGLAAAVAAGTADIRATFQGVTGFSTLQVIAPSGPAVFAPVAQFTVSGGGGPDTCRIIVGSGGDLDCRFDGSASTGGSGGAINRWTWRFDVGANSAGPISDDEPTLDPRTDCGFFAVRPSAQPGTSFVQMIVKLVVRNAAGTESAEVRNSNVRLFPQSQCGFGF